MEIARAIRRANGRANGWVGGKPRVLRDIVEVFRRPHRFARCRFARATGTAVSQGLRAAHTFQTSALGGFAACAVADYIDSREVKADCRRVAVPLAEAAARMEESGRAREIYRLGPSLSFRPATNAGDLVKACFADRVLILGGGIDGERIRIAPPLTIETEASRRALEILLSRLSA